MTIISSIILCGCVTTLHAQKECLKASPQEMIDTTTRGRMLVEYDQAAWLSSDAVVAVKSASDSVTGYVAQKTEQGWVVAYGRFNDAGDRYVIVYLSRKNANGEFTAEKVDPPSEDEGFYFWAAKALATAKSQFSREDHPQRPYNAAVLPAPDAQWFVYFVPAQTENGVYPLGADVRFLVSQDGNKIVARKQLHKTVLDLELSKDMVRGMHTHVLSDTPEDTDVFYVLSRKPSVPEHIGTPSTQYIVLENGNIVCFADKQKQKKK